jgi:hypothetical protein
LAIDPNGLALTGTWNLASAGANTDLAFSGKQSTSGTGTIAFGANAANRITTNNQILTIDAGVSVIDAGQLLANTGGSVNKGTVRVEGTNALVIDPNGLKFENQGTLEAAGEGWLILQNETFALGTTSLDVLANSKLSLTNSTVNSGTLDVALLGFIPTVGTTFHVLFAAVIDGTFDNTIVDTGDVVFAINIVNDSLVQLTAVSAAPIPAALW